MVLETMASDDMKVECYECTLRVSISILVSHGTAGICTHCDSLKPSDNLPMMTIKSNLFHILLKTLMFTFMQDFNAFPLNFTPSSGQIVTSFRIVLILILSFLRLAIFLLHYEC